MNIFILTDTQLDSKPSCDRLDAEGRSIRFEENRGALLKAMHDAKDAGCGAMAFLGDLSEERNPDSLTLTLAAEIFGLALEWGWEIYAIPGNHDGAIFSLSSHSFAAFALLNGRMHIYEVPTVVEIDGSRCLFLPYLHRKSPQEVTALAKAAAGGVPVDYVFAHYAFAGVEIGAKNMVLPGDLLDSTLLTETGAKLAFFGHIHKQQVIKTVKGIEVVFPGSPVINDFGERKDPKGYAILTTSTGKYKLVQIPPTRRWIYVEWRALGTRDGAFGEDDIVKITGEYGPGESPQDAFKALLSAGKIKEPFYKVFEVRRAAQAVSKGIVSSASGLQQAVADYFKHRWPDDPDAKPALEAAIAALKASSPAAFDKAIVLKSVHGTDFLSHSKFDVDFIPGQPLLVCGENGLGKTNIIEAVLFAMTGQVSKGLKMAALVRQGATKASVELLLQGEKGEYRINRTVSLNSKGAGSHKVDVEMLGNGQKWVSLADGGVADTQAALARLVGATFLSMRAINFQFQRDPNPFIGADPSERKAILAEILGLDALGRALKILNDERLIKMRARDSAESVVKEAASRYDSDEVTRLLRELQETEDLVPARNKGLEQAKAVTEAAVAEAGAVGSERNSLQSVIDALDGQMSGPADLTKAKTDLEASFQKGRTERGEIYAGAKKRAEEKAALAKDLPKLETDSTDADLAEAASLELVAQTAFPDLEAQAGTAERDSAIAATAAVDTKLAARSAQQVKSDADAKHKGLGEQITAQDLEIDTLASQDSKTCSKCGQAVDSAHAEAELAEARRKLETLKSDQILAKAALDQSILDLSAAQTAETDAQAAADTATKAMNEARTALDKALDASKAEVKASQEAAKATALAARNAVVAARLAAQDADQAEAERKRLLQAGLDAKEAHEASIKDLDVRIADAEKKAAEAKLKVEDARAKMAGVDDRLALKKQAVDDAKVLEKAAQDLVDACSTSITELNASIRAQEENRANAETKLAEFEAAKKAWNVADIACTGIKEVPAHLIDEKLPALADAVNAYLVEFGSPEFTISFSTRRDDGKETMDVLVDNGASPMLDVTAYSGGQLDRIEFCMRMALGDLAEVMRDTRLGFSMMDEPGTHLDEEKKGALIRMVRERAAGGKCPIAVVVSHDRKMMGAFERRLTVTRDGIRVG